MGVSIRIIFIFIVWTFSFIKFILIFWFYFKHDRNNIEGPGFEFLGRALAKLDCLECVSLNLTK